ncbi:protein takeout-like [Bacillus rossius redtenbacheri]|uniref:protein takeout-like n=1 Tax=Bacillus rossius redtenbacheri TaxID=93214 RepID=UPI002FDE2CD4
MRVAVEAAAAALVAASLWQAVRGAELPSEFKKCSRSDPDFNACLKDAAEDAIHQLKDGEPSLDVPSFDPLHIPEWDIVQGEGPISVDMHFKDVRLRGISDSKLARVNVDLDEYTFDVDSMNNIGFEGDYEVNGRVLLLPIAGKGRCNFTLTDLRSLVYQKGEPVERDGEKYMKHNVFEYKMKDLGLMTLHFEGLFNGDPVLGDTMNKFLNENWQDIFKEIKPSLEQTLQNVFKNIAEHFFSQIPYDHIFPE